MQKVWIGKTKWQEQENVLIASIINHLGRTIYMSHPVNDEILEMKFFNFPNAVEYVPNTNLTI